ncbi:epoxide hydrolase [Sphingomonas sp. Leaf412]|uniref:alpha/beta fold hydrolase n=1 Tax=Sphingomonas sp. Leaf412 TaxID=1736370 RepID=UPI0006F1CF80|nr:alpha/beta fold hydrolase [Sphingomonas sp. Leaf412]KQT34702.1 epoxide hydrolase [Sphingomonas sp. Leaf412]
MSELRMIDAGAVRLRAGVEGDGPLVLMVHGFPESWYSWRHQIGPVAAAGFTACAIDVRGYGGSDKPADIAAYDMESLVGDLVGVADALRPGEPAILVGHDWGAPIVWHGALTRPDRFRAVAALSVPFMGVAKRPFTDVFREAFTKKGRFFYQEYFQQPGVAEGELEPDVRDFLRKFIYAISGDAPAGAWPEKPHGAPLLQGLQDPAPFPAWLTDADLDYYVAQFEGSGLRGPLNRYRNHERDFAWTQAFAGRRIEQPALFIGGTKDPASTLFGAVPDPVAAMAPHVPNLEGHMLDGCGHWTQQERPAEVTRLLLDWLGRLRP